MRYNKILNNRTFLIQLVLFVGVFTIILSCNKTHEGEFYNYENKNSTYDGNINDYLESRNGLYDSLLFIIDRCPGMEDSLKTEDGTFFAVPNKCFDIALENVNEYRKKQNLSFYSLKDLDSSILDTLMSRYFIKSVLTADSIKFFTNGLLQPTIKYGYKMNLKYNRQDASGYVGGGPQQIIFTDPKDTTFDIFWVSTYTTSVNIMVKNGIVNEVSTGHEFGFGELLSKLIADKKRKDNQ